MFTASDFFLIPFSIFWGGFSLFWERAAITQGGPSFFPLFGVPFVAIGLYLIAGRFAVDAWLRTRMFYALTNRRALISRSSPFAQFTAVSLANIPELKLSPGRNGRGTIRFGAAPSGWRNQNGGAWTPALDPTPQFLGIEDAGKVFAQIGRIRDDVPG